MQKKAVKEKQVKESNTRLTENKGKSANLANDSNPILSIIHNQ